MAESSRPENATAQLAIHEQCRHGLSKREDLLSR